MTINYVTRNDSDFKIIKNEEEITTSQIISREYPYILQAMKKEEYKIEYDDFELIQEILYEDKVVGIISMINIESIGHTLCINEAYILPEYRHKGLFYQTLINLLSQPNMTISLRNPSKKIIELLIDYELAIKMKNNIVISYVDFYVDYKKYFRNKKIKTFYEDFEKPNQSILIKTDFYDMNINSSIFFDINNILEFEENPAYIELARQCDSTDAYYQKLKNVDMVYINILPNRIFIKSDELYEFYDSVDEKINEHLNVDYILGTDEILTPIFINLLYKNNLTEVEGYEIRDMVADALERKEIIPKSIVLRTLYLINNYPNFNKLEDNIELGHDIVEKCPYCQKNNYSILEVCNECGYNLQRNNHIEENLPQIIGEKYLLHQLSPETMIKEDLDNKTDALNEAVNENLFYMDFDKEEVFNIQCKMATYQLLKEFENIVYYDIYDYDTLNYIRQGSAYNYAKKNNLIKELTDYTPYYEIMDSCYTDEELKSILRRNNKDYTGFGNTLRDRVKRELSPLEIFGKRYILTDKGTEFLKKNQCYDFFIDNFIYILFYEFNQYVKEYEGKFKNLRNSFLKYMENIAIDFEDYNMYYRIIFNKLNNLTDKESEEYLVYFTQLFIIDINHWLNSQIHENGEKPLSLDVEMEYPEIQDSFNNKNIAEIFNEAYSQIKIDSLKEHEEIVLFYLIKSLEYEDIDDINREIEHDKYDEEYVKSLLFEN